MANNNKNIPAIVGIVIQVIALLFCLLGHGNYAGERSNAHAGLWKYCHEWDDDWDRYGYRYRCGDFEPTGYYEDRTDVAKAFLLLSHFVAIILIVLYVLIILDILKDKLAKLIPFIVALLEYYFVLIAVWCMTTVFGCKYDYGWSLIMPIIGWVLVTFLVPLPFFKDILALCGTSSQI